MKKYKEYKNFDLAGTGSEVLKYWRENQVFQKSVEQREGAPAFTFYEGPPSANGTPGIHHVMARTVKDIFCRFKTLRGYQVKRKGGWDTHGLPVELQVEKELGITKEDIGKKISIEEYNEKCREAVMKYKGQWDELTEKMGYWVDLDNPYITFDTSYIETLWHLLKEIYKKGYLYKGFTIQPYSPAAGTGLSSHELNQPGCYKNVKDTSVTAQFKIKGTENDFFLAWTTTPWTLPSNAALAVGESITYLKVSTFNPYTHKRINVYVAKDRLSAYFPEKGKDGDLEAYKPGDKVIPWKVTEEKTGKELTGTEYEQLLPYVTPDKPAFRIITGDFVTTEDGTGIVHIAPTFGADDYRVAQQNDIPPVVVQDENGNPVPLVDRQGKFVEEVSEFAGKFVKQEFFPEEETKAPDFKPTDVLIAIKLKEENKAFRVEKYEHSYPHCWRTDRPVLYYPLESWFIKTTAVKDRLSELNKTINWKPGSTGTGRFGNWLDNLVDWNLSRSRYWGTPLPIWRTEQGNEEKCIGSLKELNEEIEKANKALNITPDTLKEKEKEFNTKIHNLEDISDLHRPYADWIILVSESGEPMFREPDLIDVWFDSGAMPYAQWHWPFENDEVFKKNFPADFIAEGVDQTRGWFFTLHAIAGLLFDSVAYKNVIANGLVLDKNGNKMSKRLGNAIDPFDTIDKYGPDATRWYMIANAPPWDNLKFNLDGVAEVQRRFFGTLHNTYNFFALYANLDSFTFEQGPVPMEKRTESDRWIISRLNTLSRDVDEAFSSYEPTKAARAIQEFVIDDLSNWYVRLNRKRFWKGEYNEDKKAAYQTLYECLLVISKLISPVAPFYAEKLYHDLNSVTGQENTESVHLSDFPEINDRLINKDLEERMGLSQKISSLVHSIRKGHSIKVRQPLSKVLVPVKDKKQSEQIDAVKDIILNEVNVKDIEYLDDTSGILVKRIKPNFPKLGKQYGPKMKAIAGAVAKMEQDDINHLEKEGKYVLDISSEEQIELTPSDVEISFQDIPGWSVASEGPVTVALDLTITDDLKKEGIARDVVNRVQNLRKDMGLEVQDKIKITVQKKDELINAALETNKEYICQETQALSLDLADQVNDGRTVQMDDQELILRIEQ